jgi:hypothetical protein
VALRTGPSGITGTAKDPQRGISVCPLAGWDYSAFNLLARVRRPTCSVIRCNMLKFIDLEQARFRVGAGEAERARNDSKLVGSSVNRSGIVGEASRRVGQTASESSSCSEAARFWAGHFFGFSQPQKVSELSTAHQIPRPARLAGRGRRLGYDRCVRGARPHWRHRGGGPVEVRSIQ